jgi:hypothetical protein
MHGEKVLKKMKGYFTCASLGKGKSKGIHIIFTLFNLLAPKFYI